MRYRTFKIFFENGGKWFRVVAVDKESAIADCRQAFAGLGEALSCMIEVY